MADNYTISLVRMSSSSFPSSNRSDTTYYDRIAGGIQDGSTLYFLDIDEHYVFLDGLWEEDPRVSDNSI